MLRWIYDQLFKMNYKKIYILLMYVTCYADCEFQVVNYSSEVIKVEAGFHKHNNPIITFEVPKVQTKVALVKSIALCNDIEPSGLGTAYVRLVGGKSKGGFIYSPQNNRISAIGISSSRVDGVFGYAPNGNTLWLQNNYKPKSDIFQVVISKADRNTSKPSSLNPN